MRDCNGSHLPASRSRDWTLLPAELLRLISECITSIIDYISFRAVCVPWRTASSPRPLHLPAQFPWLMLPYDPNPCIGNDHSVRLFYDPVSCRMLKFDLPEMGGKRVVGSSHGWLVLEDGPNVSLLNPITKAFIILPSFTVPPDILQFPSPEEDQRLPYTPNVLSRLTYDTGEPNIFNVVLTSDPSFDSGCIVMLLLRYWSLVFCRVGDACWTILGGYQRARNRDIISDAMLSVTYHDGLFYSINRCGNVIVYDLQGHKREQIDPVAPVYGSHCYLVASASGELLMLLNDPYQSNRTNNIVVYKLTGNRRQGKWEETNDIGDTLVFVDRSCQCFSLPAGDMGQGPSGGRTAGNRLYLPYNTMAVHRNDDGYLFNVAIKVIKVEDLSSEKINPCLGEFHSTWSKSLWFTPSL